ncbi:MAG: VOC family protein [Micromonosporaceae bacterium]
MLSEAPIYATIPTRDFDRAKHFYRDTLGLKVDEESADGVAFECAGTRLYVFPTHSDQMAGHTLASWEVSDLDAEMADLRARGVMFEEYDLPGLKTQNGVAELGNIRGAWFKDSEGNILAVTTRQP